MSTLMLLKLPGIASKAKAAAIGLAAIIDRNRPNLPTGAESNSWHSVG